MEEEPKEDKADALCVACGPRRESQAFACDRLSDRFFLHHFWNWGLLWGV